MSTLSCLNIAEPQNTLSDTDWQRLWKNEENSAGNNNQDPNGLEGTDRPHYEESEVSNKRTYEYLMNTLY